MNQSDLSLEQELAIRDAFASVRGSMKAAPAFLLAVAMGAGMTPQDAKAWGSSDFESLGRVVGGELGREAAGGGSGAKSRVGGLVGEMIGARAGRPADAEEQEARRTSDIERQAREQAVRDAAYEAERRRLDPNYQAVSQRSSQVNGQFLSSGSSLSRLQGQMQALAQSYEARNPPRQR